MLVGQEYHIRFSSLSGKEDRGEFSLYYQQPLPSDSFSDAPVLLGDRLIAGGDTTGATSEIGDPDIDGEPANNSVWYQWQASSDGILLLEVDRVRGASPRVSVNTGSSLETLQEIAELSENRSSQRAEILVSAGTNYYICYAGVGGGSGDFSTELALLTVPNDDFDNATPISGNIIDLPVVNVGATIEPGEPQGSSFAPREASVWFNWSAPESGIVDFEVFTPHSVEVYSGDEVDQLTALGRDEIEVTAGEVYRIQVYGLSMSFGQPRLFEGSSRLTILYRTPPGNDDFENALPLSGRFCSLFGEKRYATLQGNEPVPSAAANAQSSIWYRWTAPDDGTVSVDTSESLSDTVLAIYQGDALENLNEVVSNDDAGDITSQVFFPVTAGEEYYISLTTRFGSGGDFRMLLTYIVPPENDEFDSPIVLSGATVSEEGSNFGAKTEDGEPRVTDKGEDGSLWYQWQPPVDGYYVASVRNLQSFDPLVDWQLTVFEGNSMANLVERRFVDNAAPDFSAQTRFFASASEMLTLRVTRNAGPAILTQVEAFGDFLLTIEPLPDASTVEGQIAKARALMEESGTAALQDAQSILQTIVDDPDPPIEAELLLHTARIFAAVNSTAMEQVFTDFGLPFEPENGGLLSLSNELIARARENPESLNAMARSEVLVSFLRNDIAPILPDLREVARRAAQDSSFEFYFSDSEMQPAALFLDRAGAKGLEFQIAQVQLFIRIASIWDFDVPLADFVDVLSNEPVDFGRILAENPNFGLTIDQSQRAGLSQAVQDLLMLILESSDLIGRRSFRASPYLYGTDEEGFPPVFNIAQSDRSIFFSFSIDEVEKSLEELFTSTSDVGITGAMVDFTTEVDLDAFSVGISHLRDLLPSFVSGQPVPGTFPDPTLDGLLPLNTGAAGVAALDVLFEISASGNDISSFANWIAGFVPVGGVPGQDTSATGDLDGDGLPNYLEFAFLTNPIEFDRFDQLGEEMFLRVVPNPSNASEQLAQFSYIRRTDSNAPVYIVEVDGLLGAAWEPVATRFPVTETIEAKDGATEIVRVRIDAPISSLSKTFLRLRVAPGSP